MITMTGNVGVTLLTVYPLARNFVSADLTLSCNHGSMTSIDRSLKSHQHRPAAWYTLVNDVTRRTIIIIIT